MEAGTAVSGGVTVGMVTGQSGIEDASFNQSAWEGLQWLSGVMECETTLLEAGSDAEIGPGLDKLAEQGCSLCWGVGVNSADAILAAAEKYPETFFAVVDCSYDTVPENVTCVVFRAEEPSFLAGYVAGSVTQNKKVGFVGGMANEVIDSFRYGYEAGVAYAAKQRGITIETEAVYADGFADQAKGRELAEGLYAGGCDIIYHAAGETGLGVIKAAEEQGQYMIGVDKDQSYLAPGHVLCSALKYVNVAVKQVSEGLLRGNISYGGVISLGLMEDAVGISEEHPLYPDAVYDEMLRLKEEIIAGTLTVPADREAYEAFLEAM